MNLERKKVSSQPSRIPGIGQKVWDAKDPRAMSLTRKVGEMIALDSQKQSQDFRFRVGDTLLKKKKKRLCLKSILM